MEIKTLEPGRSSNIVGIGYDAATKKMRVQFKGGGVYEYDGVQADVHSALMGAESMGRTFHRAVKGKYECVRVTV